MRRTLIRQFEQLLVSKTFAGVHRSLEILSFVAITLTLPVALYELHSHVDETSRNNRAARLDAAEQTYRAVDDRYVDFMKLCLAHETLDCYSTPDPRQLTHTEQLQQRVLYTILTDVFEVAYVHYKESQHEVDPDVESLLKEQWDGWDAYI